MALSLLLMAHPWVPDDWPSALALGCLALLGVLTYGATLLVLAPELVARLARAVGELRQGPSGTFVMGKPFK